MRDLQRALLKADIDVRIVLDITESIRKRVRNAELPPGFSKRELILKLLYDELIRILGGESRYILDIPRRKGYIIMLIGIQGSGKTTTVAKLAYFLTQKGYKVGVICADNYRPGAYAQLAQLLEKTNIPVYWKDKSLPLDIVRYGIKVFSDMDVIIIDTAGRHKDEEKLIEEMKNLWLNIKPNKVILVLDSTIGKAAGTQAEFFNKVSPIGSIILTKMDGAAKGGGALAAVVATGARIEFIGTGEKIEDLEIFDPPRFVNRLLGMGDISSLIERFKRYEMLKSKRIQSFMSGKITLLDLREQLESIRKMGSFKKIIDLLPIPISSSPLMEKISEEKTKKWLAAMNSMTMQELINPSIIDSSRIKRIARGSGTTSRDVKDLLKSYRLMKKYLKSISKKRNKRILWKI